VVGGDSGGGGDSLMVVVEEEEEEEEEEEKICFVYLFSVFWTCLPNRSYWSAGKVSWFVQVTVS